jgi:hypothetical protein
MPLQYPSQTGANKLGQNYRARGLSLGRSDSEEPDDSFPEKSEVPDSSNGRDDVSFGRILRDPIDLSKATAIFGQTARKVTWKSSEPYSSINSTISKDNTGGECARQAKLLAYFGQKIRPCVFISVQREEGKPLARRQEEGFSNTASNVQDDDDEDEPRYCFCNRVSYGQMVGCDADGCEREWFHLDCVGLKAAPKGNSKSSLIF